MVLGTRDLFFTAEVFNKMAISRSLVVKSGKK